MATEYTMDTGSIYICEDITGGNIPDVAKDYIRIVGQNLTEDMNKLSKIKSIATGITYHIDDGKFERKVTARACPVTHTASTNINALRKLIVSWSKIGTPRLYLFIMLNNIADETDALNLHFYDQDAAAEYHLRGFLTRCSLDIEGKVAYLNFEFKEVTQ